MNKRKRTFALALSLCMALTALPVSAAEAANTGLFGEHAAPNNQKYITLNITGQQKGNAVNITPSPVAVNRAVTIAAEADADLLVNANTRQTAAPTVRLVTVQLPADTLTAAESADVDIYAHVPYIGEDSARAAKSVNDNLNALLDQLTAPAETADDAIVALGADTAPRGKIAETADDAIIALGAATGRGASNDQGFLVCLSDDAQGESINIDGEPYIAYHYILAGTD